MGLSIDYNYNTNGLLYGDGSGVNHLTGTTYTGAYGSDFYSSIFSIESARAMNEYNQAVAGETGAISAIDTAINQKITNILSYIENSQEDNASEEYAALLNYMAGTIQYSCYVDAETGDNTALRAHVQSLLQQKLGDIQLDDFIKEYTKDAKQVQWQQNMFGEDRCDSVTQEDLLYEICGLKDNKESMKWYDHVGFGLSWFFNPWQRWNAGSKVD